MWIKICKITFGYILTFGGLFISVLFYNPKLPRIEEVVFFGLTAVFIFRNSISRMIFAFFTCIIIWVYVPLAIILFYDDDIILNLKIKTSLEMSKTFFIVFFMTVWMGLIFYGMF